MALPNWLQTPHICLSFSKINGEWGSMIDFVVVDRQGGFKEDDVSYEVAMHLHITIKLSTRILETTASCRTDCISTEEEDVVRPILTSLIHHKELQKSSCQNDIRSWVLFSFSKGCYGSEIGQFIIFQVAFTMSLSYFLQCVHGIHYLAVLHSPKRIVIHYFSPPSNLFSLHISGIFATTTAKILLCQNDIGLSYLSFLKNCCGSEIRQYIIFQTDFNVLEIIFLDASMEVTG